MRKEEKSETEYCTVGDKNRTEDKLRNSVICRNSLILTGSSISLGISYSFTCLNPLVPVLAGVYNNTYQACYGVNLPTSQWTTLLSLTMSMVIAGGFCGGLCVTHVMRILTRKQAMLLFNTIVIVGAVIISAISGPTGSYEAFIVGRFIIGIGLGIGFGAVPVVIAEYSTEDEHSIYQSAVGFGLSFGNISGPVIAHPKVKRQVDYKH